MVDRGAFDKIIQAGGFVSVNTGGVPDGNAIPISKIVITSYSIHYTKLYDSQFL